MRRGCLVVTRAAVLLPDQRRRTGQGLGVARQRSDGEALVRREGWELAEVYVDNDFSAFNGKPRPGYDRMLADLAEAGRSSGGPRTFGYEADHYTIREDEAVLVREAAARALGGVSLRSIARDWNERAIPTVRGAGWTYQSVHRMLGSPRIAGLRSRLGEVVGTAVWPPIVDRTNHAELRWSGKTLIPRAPVFSPASCAETSCGTTTDPRRPRSVNPSSC
jgi:hypothetical protein